MQDLPQFGSLDPVQLGIYVALLVIGYGLGVSYVALVRRFRAVVEAGAKPPVPFLVVYLVFNLVSFCLIAAAAHALQLAGLGKGSPYFAGLVILPFIAARLQMLIRYRAFREDAQVVAQARAQPQQGQKT